MAFNWLSLMSCKKKGRCHQDVSLKFETDSESDEDDETDQTTTDYYEGEHNYADPDMSVIDELEPLIKKVSKIVKLFQKSPTKNEEEFGKEISLILDSKTRWNSLYFMLERFCKLRNCILNSLINLI
jgi:hypothetical protein